MDRICCYHGPCADGFTAAWVLHNFYKGEIELHECRYGEKHLPTDEWIASLKDRTVIFADFCYPLEYMRRILDVAHHLVVIDHHDTAQPVASALLALGATVEFDMNRSGAGLTWDTFAPDQGRPNLVDIVEDRDLWRFKYESTRPAMAAIFSYEYTIENWNKLAATPIATLVAEGSAIHRKHMKDVRELVAANQFMLSLAGHDVPAANLPYIYSSEAGHLMCEGHPFAACFHIDKDQIAHFSLRSAKGGAHVGLIAKQFGGGGHPTAAGFAVPVKRIDWAKRVLCP